MHPARIRAAMAALGRCRPGISMFTVLVLAAGEIVMGWRAGI
jgi:hypothetical protein